MNSLLGKLQISISSGLATKKLLCSLCDAIISLTFQVPQSPACCLYIWKSHYLFQSLLTVFGREIPAFSLIVDSESFSHLFHGYAYSTFVVLLWAGFHKILCEAKPNADSFSLAFPGVVCWMLSLCAFWRAGLAFCTYTLASAKACSCHP